MAAATLKRAWAYDLSTDILYELLKLRVEVFVVEQHCAYPELDGRDLATETRHVWLEEDGEVIATLRLLEEHSDGPKLFRLTRLCTRADRRDRGHTTRLLQAALAEVGNTPCHVNAQLYLVDLYTQHGFTVDGEQFDMDGTPLIPMRRESGY